LKIVSKSQGRFGKNTKGYVMMQRGQEMPKNTFWSMTRLCFEVVSLKNSFFQVLGRTLKDLSSGHAEKHFLELCVCKCLHILKIMEKESFPK
jgi:hypothetical protein